MYIFLSSDSLIFLLHLEIKQAIRNKTLRIGLSTLSMFVRRGVDHHLRSRSTSAMLSLCPMAIVSYGRQVWSSSRSYGHERPQ